MKKYYFIILSALSLSLQVTFAQVSVNQLTGSANVVIPIYNLGRGGVSMPINLVYNGSGIRPKDVEGTAGIGWNVQTGGAINRQVHGLPDDVRQDSLGSFRAGWMYNSTGASKIASFTIANTGAPDCTKEQSDISYINSNFSYTLDTEPDVFNVNAPGLSCQLVWDNANNMFRTIPYMDVKITYTYNNTPGQALYGAITSFIITNDKGIVYLFASPELVVQQTQHTGSGGPSYFVNNYLTYHNIIKYYDSWVLKKMTDASGNGIRLTYKATDSRSSTDQVMLHGGAASGGTTNLYQYDILKTFTPQVVDTILTVSKDVTNEFFKFNWTLSAFTDTPYPGTNQSVVSNITGLNKNFQFNYSNVLHRDGADTSKRLFLRSFTDVGSATPVNYHFSYKGETPLSGGYYYTELTDSASKRVDYWGYSNSSSSTLVPALYVNPANAAYQRYAIDASASVGSDYTYTLTTGSTREVEPGGIEMGSLTTINYAQGGTTTIVYEPNDYLDVPANASVNGGGVRAKQIINHDNITGVNDTTCYFYTNPTSGKSSGKPITLPMFGFTIPYTGSATGADYWNYATIRSENDLSQDDHTIMYEYVRSRHSGAGSTLLRYSIPATNWDTVATPSCAGCSTEWRPTMNYIARPTCVTYGPIKNDFNNYPFAPNPNYDFERGLLLTSTAYVGTGTTKASETIYTYSRTGTPGTITGFTVNNNRGNGLTPTSYAKYKIYYGTSEQVASVTTNVYDTQGLTQAQTSVVNYSYGSTYHKPLTQQVTNSDASVVTTNYTYTKDYTLSAGNTNPNIDAIYQLQQLNINAPVETYSTIYRPAAGTTLLTSGALTLYSKFPSLTGYNYLPATQYQLVQPDGGSSLTPFSISGVTITKDSRYFATANYNYYDYTGILQTMDDANKHVRAVYMDYYANKPAVTIQNAAANEMAFEDFDSDLIPAWTHSYPAFTTPLPGSHTGNSKGWAQNQAISYTVQKNGQAKTYICSMWLNCGSGTTITLRLIPGFGSDTTITVTPNSAGIWKYFQWVLPVSSAQSYYTIEAKVTSAITIGVDDILFYPQNAEVSTFAYDPVTHFKVAETNTNGLSAYYTTDQWGRLLLQKDQDKNIVARNTYVAPATIPGYTKQEMVMVAGITADAQVDTLGLPRKQTSKAYYDGLGRPLQSVAVQSSPLQRDIIQPSAYDYTGRPKAAWLPYAGLATDTMGSYRSNAIGTAQPAFYNQTGQYLIAKDAAPYNQQVFENSPLQRVLSAGTVGVGYQPAGAPLTGGGGTQHYKIIGYRFNNATDPAIINWGPDGVKQAAAYSYNTLAVTIRTDEDNVQTLTYADLAGRTILKRQVFSGSVNYDTYYVYSNAGMMAYVIPPKAVSLMVVAGNYGLTQTNIAPLLFTYTYDGRGRLITKKVPGKGGVNIVYDPLNRPVLLQDANLAAAYKWNYIKYDVKGRAISQGIYYDNSHTGQTAMQTYVDGMGSSYTTAWYEDRSTSSTTSYYTNNIFPTTGITPLAYGYFDDYDLDNNDSANYTYNSAGLPNEVGATTAPIQGMPTMTLKSTVSNSVTAKWLLSVQFYDKNLRAIQTQSNNLLNYTAATTVTDIKTLVPDFTGTPTVSKTVKMTGSTTTVLTTPVYDNQKRITALYQSYNGGAPVHVANYNYNELGQLVGKALGIGSATANLTLRSAQSVGATGVISYTATNNIILDTNFVAATGSVFSASIAPAYQQLVDYRYNIRGQLTNINNSKLTNNSGVNQEDANALFGMELLYDQQDSNLGNTPYFNGKVSAVKWMGRNTSNAKSDERAFNYSYDNAGRYIAANYLRRDSSGTGAFSLTHGWDEGITGYDENGNIQALHRIASTQGSSYTNTTIDQLKYTYDANNANQLYSVTDTSANPLGFGIYTGGNSGGHYTYDVNGNMLNDPYKNMTTGYNVLNRADQVDFAAVSGRLIKYIYNADGSVLRKLQYDNVSGSSTLIKTTDYLEGFVYENGTLAYFNMPEGRVRNTGGGLKNEYILTDQQGNARISFEDNDSGKAVVRQENSYYGFGMLMLGSPVATPTDPNKKLYNGGSEWQNDFSNFPDLMQTLFRNYDADLGRWTGVDPEAESTESMSVYHYANNNPIMFNDPIGNYPSSIRFDPPDLSSAHFGIFDAAATPGSNEFGRTASNPYDDHQNWVAWMSSPEYIASLGKEAQGTYSFHNGTVNYTYRKNYTQIGIEIDGKSITGPKTYYYETKTIPLSNQGGDSPGPKANTGGSGVTKDQYLFNFGLTASTVETFSGISRLGSNLRIYSATARGGVFFGNQFVKTLGIAKLAKGAGIVGAIAGVALDGYGFINGTVSGGKFAGDTGMATFGLTGFGTLPAIVYFGIDAYYPGGFPAAMKNAAPVYNQINQPTTFITNP